VTASCDAHLLGHRDSVFHKWFCLHPPGVVTMSDTPADPMLAPSFFRYPGLRFPPSRKTPEQSSELWPFLRRPSWFFGLVLTKARTAVIIPSASYYAQLSRAFFGKPRKLQHALRQPPNPGHNSTVILTPWAKQTKRTTCSIYTATLFMHHWRMCHTRRTHVARQARGVRAVHLPTRRGLRGLRAPRVHARHAPFLLHLDLSKQQMGNDIQWEGRALRTALHAEASKQSGISTPSTWRSSRQ